MRKDMVKPLQGVRVLDFSRVLSGPFCTMLLGDMGASVVKVEPPSGDETRTWGPPFQNGESAYFTSINRNKRSLVLNLNTADGQAVAHQLAEHADIVIENFRPGKTRKLGIDYETLSGINPGIVYCSISGFGQDGPMTNRPGYDFIAQAMAGLMSLTGEVDGNPVKAGVPTADIVTGLYAAISILAALHRKTLTGVGESIDISLFDCQLSLASQVAANYLMSGNAPHRFGNAHPNIVPYQSLPTSDGNIAIAVGNDAQFTRFCSALGHPEWAKNPDYLTNDQRIVNRDKLIADISAVTTTRTTSEWGTLFDAAQIPNGPIQQLPEVLAMEHVQARNLVWKMHHPQTGELRALGNPMKFRDTQLSAQLPPPMMGEHSVAVLREFGFDEENIMRLLGQGVVCGPTGDMEVYTAPKVD